jgi:hypothetical protein
MITISTALLLGFTVAVILGLLGYAIAVNF